jgi:uncharacterized protein (DUF58 family)
MRALATPPAVVNDLDLYVRGRITGLLSGDHRSSMIGAGTELFAIREYESGDDVRTIDWNVTARTNEPHVKTFVAERALTSWILFDASASMLFGTADRSKLEVASGVALAISQLTTRRNNRLGFASFGTQRSISMPPRQGRQGLLTVLKAIHEAEHATGDAPVSFGPLGAIPDLDSALRASANVGRSRQVVVIISDFRDEKSWLRRLPAIAARHDVIAVEIRDPREQAIPDVGMVLLVDPETGRRHRVDTSKTKTRQRFADAAAAERALLHNQLVKAGADHLPLSTSGDWLAELVRFLELRKARR